MRFVACVNHAMHAAMPARYEGNFALVDILNAFMLQEFITMRVGAVGIIQIIEIAANCQQMAPALLRPWSWMAGA